MTDNEIKRIVTRINKRNRNDRIKRYKMFRRKYPNHHFKDISKYKIRRCISNGYINLYKFKQLRKRHNSQLKIRLTKVHNFTGVYAGKFLGFTSYFHKPKYKMVILLFKNIRRSRNRLYRNSYAFAKGKSFKRLGKLRLGTKVAFRAKIYCNRISVTTRVHLVK